MSTIKGFSEDNDNKDNGLITRWKCKECNKNFESNFILNYHYLLEHSKYKRPPIGIS